MKSLSQKLNESIASSIIGKYIEDVEFSGNKVKITQNTIDSALDFVNVAESSVKDEKSLMMILSIVYSNFDPNKYIENNLISGKYIDITSEQMNDGWDWKQVQKHISKLVK